MILNSFKNEKLQSTQKGKKAQKKHVVLSFSIDKTVQ